MKIVNIVGARPQFVKAAVVSRALTEFPHCADVIVHTGQHYDPSMSEVFFAELGIHAPAYHLGIGSGMHGRQTGRMLEAIEQVLDSERPDYAVVYGDTNSTLAGALAAAKLHIPVMHVEAGLRSFNRMPEEINRVVTDHVAEFLFAPTATPTRNLANEGIPPSRVHLVGDVMFDVALIFGERAERESAILSQLNLGSRRYVLCTIHRARNTDETARLAAIVEALNRVSETLPVVFPVHPRTRAALDCLPADSLRPSVIALPPVGYLDMLKLERHAAVIATDSGGVQKEAFFCQTPCVTLREETEWTELIDLNWNRLAPPTDGNAVAECILNAAGSRGDREAKPYGDGRAGHRIASIIAGRPPAPKQL